MRRIIRSFLAVAIIFISIAPQTSFAFSLEDFSHTASVLRYSFNDLKESVSEASKLRSFEAPKLWKLSFAPAKNLLSLAISGLTDLTQPSPRVKERVVAQVQASNVNYNQLKAELLEYIEARLSDLPPTTNNL